MKKLDNKVVEGFEQFWAIYPPRNGRKIGKEEARHKFYMLKLKKDVPLIIQATKNYSSCKDVKEGIGIKDAHRFIKTANGIEPWREHIYKEPTTVIQEAQKAIPRKETKAQMEISAKIKALGRQPINWKNDDERIKRTREMEELQKQYNAPHKIGDLI